MASLKNGKEIARSENILYIDVINRLRRDNAAGKKATAKAEQRMTINK